MLRSLSFGKRSSRAGEEDSKTGVKTPSRKGSGSSGGRATNESESPAPSTPLSRTSASKAATRVPAAALRAAPALRQNPSAAGTGAATPADAPAAAAKPPVSRRTLSFRRGSRKKEAGSSQRLRAVKEATADSGGGGGGAGARTAGGGGAATPVKTGGVRRTTSWQRGHRQSKAMLQAMEKAAQAAALRALCRCLPTLLPRLPRTEAAALVQTCRELRDRAVAFGKELDGGKEGGAEDAMAVVCFTHEGGEGGRNKENQDAFFAASPEPGVDIFGVFDGHGKQFGRLAGRVAADSCRAFLCAHSRWLRDEPEEALRFTFGLAHAAIRDGILSSGKGIREQEGVLLQWDADEAAWDTVDGGTTATIAVFLGDTRLVVAAVGDSSAVLLGNSGADATHEQLSAEHSPTNLAEYVRMRATRSGPALKFVYDCPDFEEFNIFTHKEDGTAELDLEALEQADAHEVMVKNARNDRFTLLLIPEEEIAVSGLEDPSLPATATIEEQAITMTRSLGDFYAHRHGVISDPEVRCISLASVPRDLTHLLLASDGIWDLWEYAEVSRELLPNSSCNEKSLPLADRAAAFCEKTRAKGADAFGERADNLTGVLVELRRRAQS